jgi:hypothetical protein
MTPLLSDRLHYQQNPAEPTKLCYNTDTAFLEPARSNPIPIPVPLDKRQSKCFYSRPQLQQKEEEHLVTLLKQEKMRREEEVRKNKRAREAGHARKAERTHVAGRARKAERDFLRRDRRGQKRHNKKKADPLATENTIDPGSTESQDFTKLQVATNCGISVK